MRKSIKIVLANLALLLCIALGFAIAACGGTPEVPFIPDENEGGTTSELTLTLDKTELTVMDGESVEVSFTADAELTAVSWHSSDDAVATVVKKNETTATVTGVTAGSATVKLTVEFAGGVKSYECAVTVTEYTNPDLRVAYTVKDADHVAEATFDKTEYEYKGAAKLTVTTDDGYGLTMVKVGDRVYKDIVREDDGSFTLAFTVLDRTESVSVELTVHKIEVTFEYSNAEVTVTVDGGEDQTFNFGDEVSFTAEAKEQFRLASATLNGEPLEGDQDSNFTFTVDKVINRVVVSSHESKAVITVSAPGGNESGTASVGTLSTNRNVIAVRLRNANAVTTDEWQFGYRLYNPGTTSFLVRYDVHVKGNTAQLINSADGSKTYNYPDADAVRAAVASEEGLTLLLVRNGASNTVYTDNGFGVIVKAFEDATRISGDAVNKAYQMIGTTASAATPKTDTVIAVYTLYDNCTEEDLVDCYKDAYGVSAVTPALEADDAVTVTSDDFTIGEEKALGEIGGSIRFTVTATEGVISTVSVNGLPVLPDGDGTDQEKEYTLEGTFFTRLVIGVGLFLEGEDATVNLPTLEHAQLTVKRDGTPITEGFKTGDNLTVEIAPDKYYAVSAVRWNGMEVSANGEGNYEVRVNALECTLAVTVRDVRSERDIPTLPQISETSQGLGGYNSTNEISENLGELSWTTMVTFGYAAADTDEAWGIWIRMRSSIGSSEANRDIRLNYAAGALQLIWSNGGSPKYDYDDAEAVRGLLKANAFRLVIVREVTKFTVYTDNGHGTFVKAFEKTEEAFVNGLVCLGTLGQDGCFENEGTVSAEYKFYDGLTDWVDCYKDAYTPAAVTPEIEKDSGVESVTFSGDESSFPFGTETVSFTVTPKAGNVITKVTVNGVVLRSTGSLANGESNNQYKFECEAFTALKIEVESAEQQEVTLTLAPLAHGEASVEGGLTGHKVGDTVKLTVTRCDDLWRVKTVTASDESVVTKQDDGWEITLASATVTLTVELEKDNDTFTVSPHRANNQNTAYVDKNGVVKTQSVIFATLKYENGLTNSKYQFGYRFYQTDSTSFLVRYDLVVNGNTATLANADSAKYTYPDAAKIKSLVAGEGLRLALVKDGASFTLYTDNGEGTFVQAFTDTKTNGAGSMNRIGTTVTTDENATSDTVDVTYAIYNDTTDLARCAKNCYDADAIVPNVTKDANVKEVTGLKSSYAFGEKVEFTVTVNEGFVVKSVTVNGESLTSEGEGKYSLERPGYTALAIDVKTDVKQSATVSLEQPSHGSASLTEGTAGHSVGDVLTLTVDPDDFYKVTAVKVNGSTDGVSDQGGGTYKVTLRETSNTITVELVEDCVTYRNEWTGNGTAKSIDNALSHTSTDVIIVAYLHFDEGFDQSAKWQYGLRLYGGTGNAFTTRIEVLNENGVLKLRNNALPSPLYQFTNQEAAYAALQSEAGLRMVFVRHDTTKFDVYIDDGDSKLVKAFDTATVSAMTEAYQRYALQMQDTIVTGMKVSMDSYVYEGSTDYSGFATVIEAKKGS